MAGSERKNITQPVELWVAASEQMERDGEANLSKWVGECMAANLDPDLRKRLPDRPTSGNPNFGKKGKKNG